MKLAFVIPRYGAQIAGGVETLVREFATRLVNQGEQVEVWSTQALDHRTWQNELPAGQSIEEGVSVFRFPVDERNLDQWVPIQIAISEGFRVSIEDQLKWMKHSVNSCELFEKIIIDGPKFDALIFAPYLFGLTFWGSQIYPDKSILLPCLHDESYAYQEIIRVMLGEVKGCIFNAEAEKDVAQSLVGPIKGAVVGMGFDRFEPLSDSSCSILPKSPYLIYLGRKELGKGVGDLLDYFVKAKDTGGISFEISLVLAGGGSVEDLQRPSYFDRPDIVDLGRVSEEDKRAILTNALALIHPSVNESFSIVLMEAWREKTPVIVNAKGAVTSAHVKDSNGGLYYDNIDEFCEVINQLSSDATLCSDLGQAGSRYVYDRYSWGSVLQRFQTGIAEILN